ncbi:MAG TPA: SCP2 sterol-binding domain-containing protein [Pseudonocardiaceae bacterium]|jgi:putative sterol carrier protein
MTLNERFEDLSTRLTISDESDHTKVVQWNITGEESGAWAFEIGNGAARLIPGGVAEPDTTITTSDDTWIAIADGKQDPMKAFMLGKVKVTGNMTLALQVTQLFQTAEPTQ